MTPEELKKIAIDASKKEYEQIMSGLQKEAKEGSFSATFSSITDGAIEQLEKAGFLVNKRYRGAGSSSTSYYEVSFNKK